MLFRSKIYRVEGANSTIVATDIASVSIVMNLVATPFIDFEVIGIPDGRGTENGIEVVIYPRLLRIGG